MFTTFLFFSQFANWISVLILLIITVTAVFFCYKEKEMPNIDEVSTCLNCCIISMIVFIICSWLMVSGERIENLECYKEIASKCLLMGRVWFIFAFLNILASLYVGMDKGNLNSIVTLKKIRKTTFIVGAVLCLLSFLLAV